ncbi:uncharacterized protein LOC111709318 [Eurytemora carolleeae]|uniref:uncharacterized protein LOC111709318 n=1 Tax=Eurytemora carolleeae TaxID=1294199 RepID=UPI000C7913EB|nr:uncharacterized protein LOC111709318 [Eurytemora carolleeae]|eukprot:XP_023338723.1 uncharacterized protein LOC111709318 [Eurytemora affinis]
MEEQQVIDIFSEGKGIHVAGGEHRGIVINKDGGVEEEGVQGQPHLCLEFRVFLVNTSTNKHAQEKRVLSYWFKDEVEENSRAKLAQQFFKELVSPTQFPRDYVGFIKKIMKLMQTSYPGMRRVEVELTQELELDKLPDRPTRSGALLFTVGSSRPRVSAEPCSKSIATEERVLELIEASYPNPIALETMYSHFESTEALIRSVLSELQLKKKIRTMENNLNQFTRVVKDEEKITIVKQMPKVEKAKQPSIAIICSQYQEKAALDSFMTNRQTFVRYATVGETQAYTLGDLGPHRVVVTKLPRTTRLLGTFQEVEYVLLVGIGGGVPHYTDYNKHVRLGDVVVSAPQPGQRFIYQQCDTAQVSSGGMLEFQTKSWCPPELTLQELARQLIQDQVGNGVDATWEKLFRSGISELGEEWRRPDADTDKLFMSIGGQDLIEVGHPSSGDGMDPRQEGLTVLHLGPVGAGKQVATDDQLRQEFAYKLS